MRSTALKKTAVVFQITAIVLLQIYAVVPLIFKSFTAHAGSIKCVGDHKKCGCSPFKVSSQTCCCFKSGQLARTSPFLDDEHDSETAKQDIVVPDKHSAKMSSPKSGLPVAEAAPVVADQQKSCCAGMGSESPTPSQGKTDKTIPEIKSSSCFGDPDYIFVSLEKSKFIRQQIFNNPPPLSSFVKYHQAHTFHDRFLEPPVPPPQNSKVA